MKLKEVFDVLNDFAPIALSNELCKIENGYDNSGIIAGTDLDTNCVLFALDLTSQLVEHAKKIGAKVIVTHHPAIYAPIKCIDGALLSAVNEKIGVISMHLNMDVCEYGIDYYMAEGLGAKKQKILTKLSSGGYGRVFETDCSLGEMADRCKAVFGSQKVLCYGDLSARISTVASFCGAGLDQSSLDVDCDLLISADVKHNLILGALEKGKALIEVTHYACENFGFKKVFEKLCKLKEFSNIDMQYYNDIRLL